MFETDMQRGSVGCLVSNGVGVFREISLLFQTGVCYNGHVRRIINEECAQPEFDNGKHCE